MTANNHMINTNKYEQYYFYTFTLSKKTYHLSPKDQQDQTKQILLNTLSIYFHTTVTEVTKDFNVHYHSIIFVPTESKRYTLEKRIYSMINSYKQFGFHHKFQFSSPENLIDKTIYITKGVEDSVTYNYIHVLNDTFDIFNIFIPKLKPLKPKHKQPIDELYLSEDSSTETHSDSDC